MKKNTTRPSYLKALVIIKLIWDFDDIWMVLWEKGEHFFSTSWYFHEVRTP